MLWNIRKTKLALWRILHLDGPYCGIRDMMLGDKS
jgi:hypothetical protein